MWTHFSVVAPSQVGGVGRGGAGRGGAGRGGAGRGGRAGLGVLFAGKRGRASTCGYLHKATGRGLSCIRFIPAQPTQAWPHPTPPPARPSVCLRAGKGADWLQAFAWTGYCLPYFGGVVSPGLCGQCLRLTNTRTLARIIVRIVDGCGSAGVLQLGGPCDFGLSIGGLMQMA